MGDNRKLTKITLRKAARFEYTDEAKFGEYISSEPWEGKFVNSVFPVKDKEGKIVKWRAKFNHFRMSLFGQSGSGKSLAIEYLFTKYRFDLFDLFVVFSNSQNNANGASFFRNFVPGNLFFDNFDKNVVDAVFAENERVFAETGEYLNVLYIFDDCVSHRNNYCDEILQLFIRGRNKNTSVIFTTQTPTLMRKDWRTNSSHILMFREDDFDFRKRLVSNFMSGIVPDIKVGDEIFRRITSEKYHAVLVDKTIDEKKVFDFCSEV